MIHTQRSPRNRPHNHALQSTTSLGFLLVGFGLGVLASSWLSLTRMDDDGSLFEDTRTRMMRLEHQDQERTRNRKKRSLSSSSITIHKNDEDNDNDADDGWKLIHVYVGPNNNNQHEEDKQQAQAAASIRTKMLAQASTISTDYFLQSNHPPQWFSQVRQDEVVSHLLHHKRHGYFVDLAANDAVRISNTYALETHWGWTGLAIEPNPVYWSGLSFRKCEVVAAVVAGPSSTDDPQQPQQPMRFKFPKRAPPQGGLVGADYDNHEPGSTPEEDQMRYTVPLADILDRFHAPPVIDYLSLDVEGAESLVLQGFPFDRYRIRVLTVERAHATLAALLQSHGYVQLKQLKRWGETLWVHSLEQDALDRSALEIDTEHYKYRERVVVEEQ